jgi:hypothetical protein
VEMKALFRLSEVCYRQGNSDNVDKYS